MKKITLLFILFTATLTYAQNTGSIVGKLTDKEYNNESLPYANVLIKGTTKGTTSDDDGLYAFNDLEPGSYILMFSFVGYETQEIPATVVAGKVTEVNVPMGASAASLDEIVITTTTRTNTEAASLLNQKKATEIKESIGSKQLNTLGVSDAAGATTKISGITSSEASGDVFVRGLGDRYLVTTMNGLAIPSDDIENKNIDLSLFPTRIIQNVGISKTYSVSNSADQASGNIDVTSRELSGKKELSIGISGGVNTNVMKSGVRDNFKTSANSKDISLGFYSQDSNVLDVITKQSWNTVKEKTPYNYGYNISLGKKFGEKLAVFATGSQSSSYEYGKGIFRQYRSNFIDDSIQDVETYKRKTTTTGLLDITYFVNENHKIKANTLVVNKLTDQVLEGGRDGQGTIFEETEPAEALSQFVRDQNTKQTQLFVTQLSGSHKLYEKHKLKWATGYNFVNAKEPNRIRNEVNFDENIIQLGRTGGFQQRKSKQKIEDVEYNGFLKDEFTVNDHENQSFKIAFGGNFRNKERTFGSQFVGVEEAFTNAINPSSIDDLSVVFTDQNVNNGVVDINILQTDRYKGKLESFSGFVNFNVGINKWNFNAGYRYQSDDINVFYDVGNIPGRIGEAKKSYKNIYPALNIKYTINDKHALRFATSKTITLPEFKEIAPFEYVSQTGQVTRGNPNLEASTNFNYDLKWEYFISSGQLVSLASFYKKIENPINKTQDRGSAGVFSYFNSGNEAEVFGLELETRINLIKSEEQGEPELKLNFNATRMWHSQDLKEVFDENGNFVRTFRYKGITKTDLQGASDWIFNSSLSFNTKTEKPINATITANYASDKIFAIGAPEVQTAGDEFYNDAIIERGFVAMDLILSKEFNKHFTVQLTGKNLLNPDIERTQLVKPSTTGIETNEVIRSYSKGSSVNLGLKYKF